MFVLAVCVRILYPMFHQPETTNEKDPSLGPKQGEELQGGIADFAAFILTSMLASVTIALMSGSVAVVASFHFNKVIYGQLKSD